MSPITSRHAQLLSNGRYTVMLTAANSGFSLFVRKAVKYGLMAGFAARAVNEISKAHEE